MVTKFYKRSLVEVVKDGPALSQIRPVGEEGKEFWVKTADLRTTELSVHAVAVDGLGGYVTRLRIVYPPHAQTALDNLMSNEGIILDSRTRPVQVGKRGGTTLQYTVAAEIEFALDTPGNLLPEGTKQKPDGTYKLNSLDAAVALLKAGVAQTHFV